jgi:hypothetical protein
MHFPERKWEEFIEAACRHRPVKTQTGRYLQVKRLGGSGDAGRDVEARLKPELKEGKWDLYQGKHYDHRLTPSDAFVELVKFFKHLHAGTYPRPRFYLFCSPQNAGPQLHDLLASPIKFKQRFLKDWSTGDTGLSTLVSDLTPEIRDYVESFDFDCIQEVLVRDLIAWHATEKSAHHELFGIEAERGEDPSMPPKPSADEMTYISELLHAYSEHGGSTLSLADIDEPNEYAEHFSASRASFYCAEGLKRFSRDLYTEDEFGILLNMVLLGVRPHVTDPTNKTGLERLAAAIGSVSGLALSDSILSTRLRGGDLPGTCHHLANEGRIRWVKR